MYCEKLAAQDYLGTFTDLMSEAFTEQIRTPSADRQDMTKVMIFDEE
jgi:hypothetical protein